MKQNILLLANPNGKKVTPEKIKRLQDIFSLGDGKLFYNLVVTENFSQLEKVVTEYKSRGVSMVGIIGGDGTVMHTRTFIENTWDYYPLYAFFPEGTMNNIQRALGLGGKDSSSRLARHIVNAACTNTLDTHTIFFPSLDLNGRKGFNIGFGLMPKLLWLYYGHSAKQYRELEEALQRCAPEQYQTKYEEITGKHEAGFFDLFSKERGLWGAAKTLPQLLNGLRRHTDEEYLLHKFLPKEIIFDGQRQSFPQTPFGIYISYYEEVNLGLGRLNPILSPGARKEEGKFQVVVPYGKPFSIIPQLPKLIAGKKLSNSVYQYISKLELPAERVAQVDGELLLEKGFKVAYDGKRRVVILPVTL